MFVLVTLEKFPEFTRYVGMLQAVFHGMKAGNLEAVRWAHFAFSCNHYRPRVDFFWDN